MTRTATRTTGIGHAVKSTAGAIKETIQNIGTNLAKTGATLFGGIGKMTFGFVKNLATGHVGDAFKSLSSGIRDATFGTLSGALTTVFTAAGDGLKISTHLLPDSVGSKIRAGFDKGTKHVVEQASFAVERFARIFDVANRPINDFIADLESAVKKGLSGDFKGLAKGFGSAFLNMPGNVKDRLAFIVDSKS